MANSAYVHETPARGWRPALVARDLRARIARRLALGLHSRSVHLGLNFQLDPATLAFRQPGLALRRLTPAYRDRILPEDTSHLSAADQMEVEQRREYCERLPDRGYVVVDEATGEPCYLMWVLTHLDNELLKNVEATPPLQPHQALMEGAYVPPHYRGRRIMAPAGTMIMAKALELGATEALSFIGEINTPSLRGAYRVGFRPYRRHVRHHLLFGLLKFDRYEALSSEEIAALKPE